jgi:hypothetical protein
MIVRSTRSVSSLEKGIQSDDGGEQNA